MLYYVMLYCIILYYIILHYIILYYIILYYIILYYIIIIIINQVETVEHYLLSCSRHEDLRIALLKSLDSLRRTPSARAMGITVFKWKLIVHGEFLHVPPALRLRCSNIVADYVSALCLRRPLISPI